MIIGGNWLSGWLVVLSDCQKYVTVYEKIGGRWHTMEFYWL